MTMSKINNLLIFSKDDDSWDEDKEEEVKFEGYLIKISSNKTLLKRWFKLIHRDFYYYKTNGDNEHQGMHNLSGVFVKEEKPEVINGVTFYPFSVMYPKKNRTYYCEKNDECKGWVQSIRKATGYLNLTDIYEVKVSYKLLNLIFILFIRKNLEMVNLD